MRWREAVWEVRTHERACHRAETKLYRCQKFEKQCVFFEIPKDPVSEYVALSAMHVRS